jgi:hypothetical protein
MTERDIFVAALQLEPAERPGLLGRECANDVALRERVEMLLAAHAAASRAGERRAGGRRWRLALDCGLAGGLAAILLLWFFRAQYTAVSLLHVSANNPTLVFAAADDGSATTFEIYKATQRQLLTSDLVVIAALRKPDVASLDVFRNEDDPVKWLAGHLRVDFPNNADIMRVSLTTTKADDAATLVTAVVDAFVNEAVDVERAFRQQRLAELEKQCILKDTELRSKKSELKGLSEAVGDGDTGVSAINVNSSRGSIDVEMLRGDIENVEKVLAPIAEAREKLKVELSTPPRITVWQKAVAPRSADSLFVLPELEPKLRWLLLVLAAVLAPAAMALLRTGREWMMLVTLVLALAAAATLIAAPSPSIAFPVIAGLAIFWCLGDGFLIGLRRR